ncbi:MAG: histidine phosphatase family protein [Tissierellia bacterium]|nr:histidine phosphatase family protein [Tissierellia bacterium]
MRKIYLIRHGESQWNVLRKIQGQKDIPLTDKGRKQAELAGEKLSEENIDIIYSSDLKRASETAEIIGQNIGIEPIYNMSLREINFGIWEGLSNDSMNSKYRDEVCLWRREPEKLNIQEAENLYDVQRRAMNFLNFILENEKDENILVVSHGVTLKTIILDLLNMDLIYFKNLTIDNTGLSIIEFREYNRVLKLLNDISHLKENLSI